MRLFGPVQDHCCLCRKYRRVEFAGHRCEKCGVLVTTASVRGERFAHLDLAVPLQHPWLPDHAIQQLLVLPPLLRLLPSERDDPDHDPDRHTRDAIATDQRNMEASTGPDPSYEWYPAHKPLAGTSALYADLVARNEALRAMLPRAPTVIVEHATSRLQHDLDALFGPPTLARNPRGRRLRDLLLAALARKQPADPTELRPLLLAAGLHDPRE